MTPRERAKIIVQQLHKTAFTQPDRTYRDGDPRRRECILARVSERLESQSDPLPPASAAAIARELMHI
jgi:hypothetical protein